MLLDQLEYLQKELAEKNEQIRELLQQQNQNQKLLVESKRTWIQRLLGLNVESA